MAHDKDARDRRLAEALRANLHRRKGQSRARDTLRDGGQDAGPASDAPSAARPANPSVEPRVPDSPLAEPDIVARQTRDRR